MRTPSSYRDNTLNLTLDGHTMSTSEWARELGLNASTICKRRARGWTDAQTLTSPSRRGRHPPSLRSKKRGPKPVRRRRGRPKRPRPFLGDPRV